ncbi:unnamed protein product [Caenorhabditis bovis]|uniref:Uncharacterized protein n=1 Tax=Caenorhabditis bovis TaxID=2654633 RepID=A0A8S1F5T5_9PELO|nr:unnamed protein product [Caenorhabditis bovis]
MIFAEKVVNVIRKLVEGTNFEVKCVPLQVVIRLLESAIRHNAVECDENVKTFIDRSEALLEQKRPAVLIHHLFSLYANPKVFQTRKPDGWLNVLQWCLTNIDDPSTTVFVRRQIQNVITQLSSADARRLMIISAVLQIFHKWTKQDNWNNQIVDVTTRILSHYSSDLVPEECLSLVDDIYNSPRIGENTIKFIVGLYKRNPSLKLQFGPDKWKNEANRIDVATLTLATNDGYIENSHDIMEIILPSPTFKIRHIILVINLLSEKQITEFMELWAKRTAKNFKFPLSDIAELLPKLKDRVPLQYIADFLLIIGARVIESCSILVALQQSFGSEIFETPEFAAYRDMIQKIVNEEKVMEIVSKNFYSPYVFTTCLLILHENYGGVPVELAIKCVLESPDPPPRRYCMQILTELSYFSLISTNVVVAIIETALEDMDSVMRFEGLAMAQLALQNYNNSSQCEIKSILNNWKDDRWIGTDVRKILNIPIEANTGSATHLIEEMMNALSIHRNDDDTMDCY